MSLAIIVVIVTSSGAIATIYWIWTLLKHWFGYMVERREPISQDNQQLIDIATELVRPEREEEEKPERGGGGGEEEENMWEEEEEEEEYMWDLSEPESEEDEENMWHFNASPDQENDGTTSAAAPVASSLSLSSAVEWKYDVFLSFRGPDTRKGITFELYDRLQRRGIKTFMDDRDLEVGDVINPTLLAAIRESRFAIVVLSQNYASSTWCLGELREICLCMKDNSRILPLFYQVDPTDVRYQKRSFEEAFTNHESSGRHESEKVKQWKTDLNKVANISGWNTNDHKTHRELVEVILESVSRKVVPDANLYTGDFEAYEATRKAMDEVMNALNDDKVNAVAVYGMGGVGKTAMVNHVGALAKTKGIFHHKIMAVVSQNPNFEKLQVTLAELLGLKLEKKSENGRADTLHKEIMRREKLLIILDDVWRRTELSKIGIPSYKELQKRKSKVLLTTRIRNVCHAMECQKSVTLTVLSKEDSWTLFVTKARRSFESTKFEDVARRVAGECRGLPIALIAVARALGDKDLQEWEKAAQRLEKSQVANHDHEEDAFKCLRLSYDYLKDDDSKSCFLLCCLFPEDSDIKIEQLFRYAIGKGLFRDDDTIYEARKTADSVVKYLIDSSLLVENWDEKYVRMHDVIRDTALNIAKSEDGNRFLVKAGTGLKDWPCRLREDYSAVSLMDNELAKLPEELVCQKLQILLLRHNRPIKNIPETFFQSPNELSVLDLSSTSIDSLPQSFSLLTNLQALYLDHCHKMTDISMLGKLTKLEILSMKQYPLEVLSREIGRLTNLRMLDISDRGPIVTIPANVISKLHRLEELYMLGCEFRNWGKKVEGEGEETNIGFDEIIGLSNLKILQANIFDAESIPKEVEVEPNWVDFVIGLQPRDGYGHYSKSLILGNAIRTLPDWFVNVATEKTEALKYICCGSLRDMFMEYEHGRLHGLKSLTIYGPSKKLKVLMSARTSVPKQPVFENLEQLHLTDLDCLKELCAGELPPASLINLKVLEVWKCPNFGNVRRWLPRLPNLELLRFNQIDNMEYVFGGEGFVPEQPKLIKLLLLNLVALRGICNGPTPPAMFPSLRYLVIHSCNLLQSVFTSDVAQCLSQLEILWVEDCSSLEIIIEAAEDKKIVLPKLEYLVLKELPNLVYSASAKSDIECPSLKHLYVKKCPPLSFPGSASDHFHSRHEVQFNDENNYSSLEDRFILREMLDKIEKWRKYEEASNAFFH